MKIARVPHCAQVAAALKARGFEVVKDVPGANFLIAKPVQAASAIPLPGQTAVPAKDAQQSISALSTDLGVLSVRKEFTVRTLRGARRISQTSQAAGTACPGQCPGKALQATASWCP
jgi:hypothetical protein